MEQRVGRQQGTGTDYRHRRHWLLLATAFALASLVAACGASTADGGGGTASGMAPSPAVTSTTVGEPVPAANATTNPPASGGETITAVPLDGHALAGQDRLGAPGLGTFLFFDVDG